MFIFRNVMTLTKLCISISQFLSEIKSTNYCSDSDEFLVNFLKKQPPNLNAPSTSSLTLPTCSSTYTEHNSSLANENILHYIAGSIVNSLLKKSMCTKCANWLHSEDNNHCDDNVQIYSSKRNFGCLHFPSSCFFTLIRICEETFNRHTKLLLSNQLTETTYISIVLSMSSHIIIPACCKLAHLIIKKFLIVRSTSLANHITENLQHKLAKFFHKL
jgi:hypothetical protein